MNLSFICALLGIGLTAIGLTDVADWPLWPVSLPLEYLGGIRDPFEDRATSEKAVILVSLIAANSSFWAFLFYAAAKIARRVMRKQTRPASDHR